jgi:protein-S-isoprenylcysteine O-methyltransferase Ste14
MVDAVIAGGWVAFWVYWLAIAVATRHSRPEPWSGFTGVRMRAAILVLVLIAVRSPIARGHQGLVVHSPALKAVGLTLFLIGLGSAVWARIHLGRQWGVPMSQRAEPELVTSGPYRFVRHPIYSGILLGAIGTAVAVGPRWIVAVVALGIYFIYSATVEERRMAEQFPTQYPAYKARTRMLIPVIF